MSVAPLLGHNSVVCSFFYAELFVLTRVLLTSYNSQNLPDNERSALIGSQSFLFSRGSYIAGVEAPVPYSVAERRALQWVKAAQWSIFQT